MLFSSLTFLILFLPISLGVYYLTPSRRKTEVMLLISLLFLLSGGILAALVELFLTAGTFAAGIFLEYLQQKGERKRSNLMLLVILLVYLTALLFLRSDTVQSWKLSQIYGADLFPLGLSFFTLQGMGYCVDVWQKKMPAERNWRKLSLYLLFYPRLMMGPVVSYPMAQQSLSSVSLAQVGAGLYRFFVGLAKKLLLADAVAMLFTNIVQADPSVYSVSTLWIGAFAKLLALYLELSGYADMAIGLAQCYGVKLPESYGRTIFYPTLHQFAEQWNKTVTQWFVQYLGVRLPGKRAVLHVLGIMLTWACILLWYQFRWQNFVLGLLLGLCIGLEHMLEKKKQSYAIRYFFTTAVCSFCAAFLSFPNETTGLAYLKGMFGMGHISFTEADSTLGVGYFLVLLIAAYVSSGNFYTWVRKAERHPYLTRWFVPLHTLSAILLFLLDFAMLIAAGGSVDVQLRL